MSYQISKHKNKSASSVRVQNIKQMKNSEICFTYLAPTFFIAEQTEAAWI